MTWINEVRIFDSAGVEKWRANDFLTLSCVTRVNSPGLLRVDFPGDHTVLSYLTHRGHVELWRKNDEKSIDWYRHFGGLFLKHTRKIKDVSTYTIYASGYNWLLSTRIVNYYAGYTNRTAFINKASEYIMKVLVNYNISSLATVANGRKRDGVLSTVTSEGNSDRGTTQDWYCFGENLLESLQSLAKIAGGDFDLKKTGVNAFTFYFYPGQLGTDRTSTIVFSTGYGNLTDPEYNQSRIEEGTVACVWGPGQDIDRSYVTRTGADYSALNDREIFINASDVDTIEGMDSRGDEKLISARAEEHLLVTVIQTPSCELNRHYFLGDKVTVIDPFTSNSVPAKVVATTLDISETGEIFTDVELVKV